MRKKSVRMTISMTPEMHDLILQIRNKQPRPVSEAEIIRQAIREYIDDQEDVIGSRRHFQKSLQEKLAALESAQTFHLNLLVYLVAALDPDHANERIAQAILAARRDGEVLLKQIAAVRKLK